MIKLPDYRTHSGLNDVRNKMRADLIDWQDTARPASNRISRKDLEALETVGLAIDLAEIDVLGDDTFSFRGERVLLHIMAPGNYGLPKYHISNCDTWIEMKARGRKDRYVASRRLDGTFTLDIANASGKVSREEHQLDVCKNCLRKINWENYDYGPKARPKSQIFQNFSLSAFFEKHRISLVKEKPRWTPETMPSAHYTDDFDEVSSAARKAANWKCSGCKRTFTKAFERRFLHTHHKNGVKGDNSPDNLFVLCLGCHAAEPDHQHMKRLPDYAKFTALYGPAS